MSAFQVRRVRASDDRPSPLRRFVRIGLPLVRIFAVLRRHALELRETPPRHRRLQRLTMVVIIALVTVLILFGALKAIVRLKEIALGMMTIAAADLPTDPNGYTNILLLGRGDKDHDGIDLTDTIIVASLDPSRTRSAVLLSIPRDTYFLHTENMGRGRVNSLYRDAKVALRREGMSEKAASMQALTLLGEEIGVTLGIKIHGSIVINFSGFEQVVDLLGGVDVDVPAAIVDPEYPGPNYTYETFRIDAGQQHLDGATALKYVRSRHTTSDFSRSARQQQVITALATRVKEQGIIRSISRINELLGIVSENLESTFTSRELLGLAMMGKSIDPRLVLSIQLSDRNGLYSSLAEPGGFLYAPPREDFEGASVLLPVSLPETPVTWKQVQTFLVTLVVERALFLRPASLAILNAGAPSGTARMLGAELTRYAFRVDDIRNFGKRGRDDRETSFIVVRDVPDTADDAARVRGKIAKATATFLSTTLGIPVRNDDASIAFDETNASLAIVLGKTYDYRPLQDLLHR